MFKSDRFTFVLNENRRKIIDMDGEERLVGPKMMYVSRGYACFTNDGEEQAYDADCNPCEFDEEDAQHMHLDYEWRVPEKCQSYRRRD